jgi:hypothetical protein
VSASSVEYRRAREEDVPAAVDLYRESVGDMFKRHGIVQPVTPREIVLAAYGHVFRTGVFHVAEADGRIDGIASAVVRDKLWFLSTFWVRPGAQQRGLGTPLLDRAWQDGVAAGATTFFTYASVDRTGTSMYLRRGMVPGWQILVFAGAPKRETVGSVSDTFSTPSLTVDVACGLDAEVRATRREVDHAWWLGATSPFRGRAVARGGEIVGYYYVVKGSIGPACWTDERHADAVMSLALRDAASDAAEVKMIVPGPNHAAIRFALAAGLRYVNHSHFLTTSPFGRMERYLPSGPSLF